MRPAHDAQSTRIAVLDRDSGFLQVLSNRLDSAGWSHRAMASPVPLEQLVAMRLNAVVIDLAVLGPHAWGYLETLCAKLPSLGVVVCTGQSSVAQRVWGYAMVHGDRSVDVFVRKLRQKLERASPGWRYIHTHFGIGYRFDPQPVGAAASASGGRDVRREHAPGAAGAGPRARVAHAAGHVLAAD